MTSGLSEDGDSNYESFPENDHKDFEIATECPKALFSSRDLFAFCKNGTQYLHSLENWKKLSGVEDTSDSSDSLRDLQSSSNLIPNTPRNCMNKKESIRGEERQLFLEEDISISPEMHCTEREHSLSLHEDQDSEEEENKFCEFEEHTRFEDDKRIDLMNDSVSCAISRFLSYFHANELNNPNPYTALTPLHYAAYFGKENILSILTHLFHFYLFISFLFMINLLVYLCFFCFMDDFWIGKCLVGCF